MHNQASVIVLSDEKQYVKCKLLTPAAVSAKAPFGWAGALLEPFVDLRNKFMTNSDS
jgi:hypothetical protein